MYFIDKRIQVICDQLKALRIRDSSGGRRRLSPSHAPP